jgi:lipopolysaccharide/colanic/teichoic acid biosynthesis glycosyltransferase
LPLTLVAGSCVAWGTLEFWIYPQHWLMVVLASCAYLTMAQASVQFAQFARVEGIRVTLVGVTILFCSVVAALAFSRIAYSRSFLIVAYLGNLAWFITGHRRWSRRSQLRIGVLPSGVGLDLLQLKGINWVELVSPQQDQALDAVVVDLHERLPPEWVRFVADYSLRRLPVYHAALVYEAITGRVALTHLSAGVINEFRVSPLYLAVKRLIDFVAVVLTAPVVVPLLMVVAFAIRLESSGPVLFWQERMGLGARPFRMVKFRSMHLGSESRGAQFATTSDGRVTRLGKLLRKFRIDELPQFWNILRGEMSLIGPRPEQLPFCAEFEKEIPFFGYRHLVRPGITGWAQVTQGYVASAVETRDKLEHDLYYIRHLSFPLDILIVFKTIRTVLTGFGAR